MVIKRLKKYFKLSGGPEKRFFYEKYGETNPIARIDQELNLDLENIINFEDYIDESYDKQLEGNYLAVPCIHNYWVRAKHENLPLKGLFYYSHIHNNGEIIHSSEIGEEVSEKYYYQKRNTANDVFAIGIYPDAKIND